MQLFFHNKCYNIIVYLRQTPVTISLYIDPDKTLSKRGNPSAIDTKKT
jgi:hypothetical protein